MKAEKLHTYSHGFMINTILLADLKALLI